ncbi:Uncharacterised protein [Streptococcus pneumoniae]|nr:Uncharacterised protein [Streptococcus pneumoniae]
MEMMELPSQEILIFTKQIRHWILSDQVISGKKTFLPGRYSKRDFRFVRKH